MKITNIYAALAALLPAAIAKEYIADFYSDADCEEPVSGIADSTQVPCQDIPAAGYYRWDNHVNPNWGLDVFAQPGCGGEPVDADPYGLCTPAGITIMSYSIFPLIQY